MGGPVADEDIDASVFRANVCMVHFPGMKWRRSFLDRESWTFHCIYEANSAKEIIEHAVMAAIPCATVTKVEEFLPEDFQ
jgi:hypothetical protein